MDLEGMVVWNFVALEVFKTAFACCRCCFLFECNFNAKSYYLSVLKVLRFMWEL